MASESVTVLATKPPAPVSMTRFIFSDESVGSAEAASTGFLNLTPQNSVLKSAMLTSPLSKIPNQGIEELRTSNS
jgi:hypothetical protein